jgi:hypothetical protein
MVFESTIRIDRGIPIPGIDDPRSGAIREALRSMEPGDSFVLSVHGRMDVARTEKCVDYCANLEGVRIYKSVHYGTIRVWKVG